jgi:hypothetical protein
MSLGIEAYNLVTKFESFSPHRTGGVGNQKVIDWLTNYLRVSSWKVHLEDFSYQHYEGEFKSQTYQIEGMLLYYSVLGKGKIENPLFFRLDDGMESNLINSSNLHEVEELIIQKLVSDAQLSGYDGLILESISKSEHLSAINSHGAYDLNFPIILVDKETFSYIRDKRDFSISYEASVVKNQSSNILATCNIRKKECPFVITTPISGWFSCAGERGCGISIALLVAREIAKYHSVDLVFANGHELGYRGAYKFVESYDKQPKAVLHLGSCLANKNTDFTGTCYSNNFKDISNDLAKLGILTKSPDNNISENEWVGESKCWAAKNVPMLSVAGTNPYFHTEADVTPSVTSAKLLDGFIKSLSKAALSLV